ncbi:MAG: phosphatase PAP2 family protein [Gemmatimonadales bacterium]|nr:phosphatase PAP2 family protein [Gemmatimonadales bacterium]
MACGAGPFPDRAAAGALGLLYAAGMGFALVYLGEHYVADLLGGILVASLCWWSAPHALSRQLPPALGRG